MTLCTCGHAHLKEKNDHGCGMAFQQVEECPECGCRKYSPVKKCPSQPAEAETGNEEGTVKRGSKR